MQPTDIAADLADELSEVMKADSRSALRSLSVPLLDICADQHTTQNLSVENRLEALLESAISVAGGQEEARALSQLFLGSTRWQPLAVRGPKAAKELGIGYDALRRRDKTGIRRLDSLTEQLALAVLTVSPLDDLMVPSPVPDPGEDVFDRASVFLSYSRTDDAHEGGIVSQLRDQLVAEFRLQTGQDLFVFLDAHSIEVGENWQRRLETGIKETTLLLVLLTPSYLRSENCRSELERFMNRERKLGRDDLILPVYYVSIVEADTDPLARALLEHQYTDWRGLRFLSFESMQIRQAVAGLATSVAAALARTVTRTETGTAPDIDEQPAGLIEDLAEMELAMPRLVRNMYRLIEEQEGVTSETQRATAEIQKGDNRGLSSAARLITAKRLAKNLDPHATRMEAASDAIRSDLEKIDGGVSALAREIPFSDEDGIEDSLSGMITALRSAWDSSVQATAVIETMAGSYSDVGSASSTLRPVLGRLIAAARVIQECQSWFSAWVQKLEAADAERAANDTTAQT